MIYLSIHLGYEMFIPIGLVVNVLFLSFLPVFADFNLEFSLFFRSRSAAILVPKNP